MNTVSFFYLLVTLLLLIQFKDNWPFVSREEANIDFQDGSHGGHLGFPIGTVLPIFDLQETLPSKIQVN